MTRAERIEAAARALLEYAPWITGAASREVAALRAALEAPADAPRQCEKCDGWIGETTVRGCECGPADAPRDEPKVCPCTVCDFCANGECEKDLPIPGSRGCSEFRERPADAHAGTDACGWCPDCVQGKPCPCRSAGTDAPVPCRHGYGGGPCDSCRNAARESRERCGGKGSIFMGDNRAGNAVACPACGGTGAARPRPAPTPVPGPGTRRTDNQ